MKKTGIIILLSLTYFFLSCGNDAKKQSQKQMITAVNKLKPVAEKKFKKSALEKSSIKDLTKRQNRNVNDDFAFKKEPKRFSFQKGTFKNGVQKKNPFKLFEKREHEEIPCDFKENRAQEINFT